MASSESIIKGLKFKDALRYALINYENTAPRKGKIVERGQALKHVAFGIIHIAINGTSVEKLAASRELIDRLDGKATQSISGIEGEPITIIKRVIVQHTIESEPDTNIIEAEEIKTIN